MKKIIAGILVTILASAGYVFVDKSIEDRVGDLEVSCSSMQAEIESIRRESHTEPTTGDTTGTTANETHNAPAAERDMLLTFGGIGGDTFRHVAAAKDGGYIVTGIYRSTDGDYADTDKTWKENKSAVIKFDQNGAFRWKAAVGSADLVKGGGGVLVKQSAELTNGSIVAVGETSAKDMGASDVMDAVMICYDANGSRKWLKRFAGSGSEVFECVCATPDGGFVAGGRTNSADGDLAGLNENANKAILVKYSADGTKEWIQSLNSGTLSAYFNAVAVTDTGYIYASCISPSALGYYPQFDMQTYAGYGGADSIIFKFNPSGTLLNHRTIAGSGNDFIYTLAIADGGVIAGGAYTNNVRDDSVFAYKRNYGDYDAFLIRLDSRLTVEWIETFGGTDNDSITGVTPIAGGYAAVGSSNSADNAFSFLGSGKADAFVLTVSENGSDVRKTALNGAESDQATGVVSTGNGRKFAVVGSTGSTTNCFSGLTPAPTDKGYISFFGLFSVK